jgi:hypothetical protein
VAEADRRSREVELPSLWDLAASDEAAAVTALAIDCACGLELIGDNEAKEEVEDDIEAVAAVAPKVRLNCSLVDVHCLVAYHEKNRPIALSASVAVLNDARYIDGILLRSFASNSFIFLIGSGGGSPDNWRKRRRSSFNRSTVSIIKAERHCQLLLCKDFFISPITKELQLFAIFVSVADAVVAAVAVAPAHFAIGILLPVEDLFECVSGTCLGVFKPIPISCLPQ